MLTKNKKGIPIFKSQYSIYPLIAFAVSLATYWLTVDPGASYWDCPEYLITALRLEIGHPPGNPGWALTHRFASCFFPAPATQTLVVNLMSGLFTALSVMLLCIVSISMMRWIAIPSRSTNTKISQFSSPNSQFSILNSQFSILNSQFSSPNSQVSILNSQFSIGIISLAASLCFAWSDSVWYSAVEAEVYAMSLFLSALTIWMALKWAFSFSASSRSRWLIALAYIIGFSLGVHQLNLLALPAIALIMVSGIRRWKSNLIEKRIAAFIAGCIVVVAILKGVMPGAIALAKAADVWAVNSFKFPFWSGAIAVWSVSLISVVVLAILLCRRWLKTGVAFWCIAAVMTGYSIYILIPIRAWANPPVNEGDPSTIGRFADYLDRRQYGGAPLFYGRTPESRVMRMERISVNEEGDTAYDYSWNAMKVLGKDMHRMIRGGRIPERSRFLTDEDRTLNRKISKDSAGYGYVVTGFRTEPIYTPELNMFLPRIHSSNPGDRTAYSDWTGMDSTNMVRVKISQAIDSLGNPVAIRNSAGQPVEKYALRPTYIQSLSYMLGYQIGYMYLRYLMWNFSGRQNDIPASGEIDHGNFITGIPIADNLMLGDQSALPDEMGKHNKGHNVYWMIPFIIGLIGIVWLFAGKGNGLSIRNMRSAAWYSLALFIMTGIAIVVYLNQTPGEPRERDYTFLGSYWAFSLWIAFGMLWIVRLAKKRWQRALAMILVCALPVWMLAENLDDHDRSGRSATLDYASNLLESLDKDAILFVDGDNYVFPLWYAQEVMGIRPDVSVVCNSFLACDWYLPQLMTPREGNEGIAMTATEGDVALGNYNLIRFPRLDTDTIDATEELRALYSNYSATPSFQNRWLRMGRDSTDRWIFDILSVPGKNAGSIGGLRELAVIDIIATNAASRYPRPIYWQQSLGKNKYNGFFPYTRQALYTRKLMPLAPDSSILIEESLNALPRLKWGGIDRMKYPGPDVSSQAELQRASLIRLAESLAKEGSHDLALHMARMAMIRYPSSVIPYGIRQHIDSAYFEVRSLAAILMESGTALGDSAAIAESKHISQTDSLRTRSYLRYRQAIPASRRSAISPTSNNHSIRR
ncbi:MAG: DUF2723 domain-containing protein [Muribaculum sp.]|nr:DUF2723 domain-containing protein [Muribaculum sp.]